MKTIWVIAASVLLAACTSQTPDGRECNGQIPLITTRDGSALTTNTANCIAEQNFETEPAARKDADISAVHRQMKAVRP